MESSDADDEEDRVSVRRRDQIDRKAREDDCYRLVSDLSEGDYILMRDNNLLGPLGESTEEELMRRRQLMKENPLQNSEENPERHATDDVSSDDSLIDCLTASGQTENVTSEQKEYLSWKEESQNSANSDELRFGLERNLDRDDENSNPEDECVASAKLPRREDTEGSQQVETPQSEPLFTTPSASEQDTMETLVEVPPTRSQRRLRRRSPVYRSTRARTDSWSPPHSRWEFFPSINEDIPSQTLKEPLICENERSSRTGHEETLRQEMPGHELQNRGDANVTSEQKEIPSWKEESPISANSDELRFGLERNLDPDDENSNPENECVASAKLPRREDTEDSQRQVESPQSESLFTRPSTPEQDMTETLMEVPPTRSQRRLRSSSPVYRRTRARTDSWSPPHSLWEIFPSINEDIPSQTFKQPLISENERFSRTGHEESLRQQMPGHELQNRDLIKTSKTRNAVHEECDSDTMCSSESWEVMETNPTTPFNLEVGQVHYQACSQRDSRLSRTQLTSDSPNNTTTSESEQEELKPMFSHSDEANESASVNTIRNPVHRILNTSLSDTISVSTQSTLWQTMTGFSNSSNLMDSDSNLEHSVSPPSENIERAESPNERHGPSGSESRPGSASNARYDPDSSIIVISDSSPYLISSSASSPILISSSNDEDSETSSLILVESEERSLPTGLSETRQEGGRTSPIIIDDSDSGSSLILDQFFLLNEDDPYETIGLTRAQIDNLPLRYFGENEEFKACSICITEYTEGNTLRILPCSHEFHDHCIDHWLAEHITCPICRGPVVDPPEADNSM
ncbi:unnamed protein product [Rangifer tarandus platyrhynchus]|uniref:RING-type E3 ubiquitin transferase n=1 Tax=Rangifer tarandus platyrhynchus TaxID=3082113 RepID=A0ABN9A261_RANTA|nr:unnamed protein product [Rangifer tarandus platyrhynchus]